MLSLVKKNQHMKDAPDTNEWINDFNIEKISKAVSKPRKFLYHLLLWSIVVDDRILLKTLIKRFGLNPFRVEVFNRNCLHMGAAYNRVECVKIIIQSNYRLENRRMQPKLFKQWINLPSPDTGENCIHFAVANNHYDMALLLIQNGVVCDWINNRGLKPLEVHKKEDTRLGEIQFEWEKISRKTIFGQESRQGNTIGKLEEKAFYNYSSGYQICIVAKKDEKHKNNSLFLKRVSKCRTHEDPVVNVSSYQVSKNADQFRYEYKFFDSISSENLALVAIKVSQNELSNWAERLQLLVYNLRSKFTLEYDKSRENEFEVLKNKQIQTIIKELLAKVLNIGSFEDLGQIDRYFFLHDYGKLAALEKAWKFKEFLTYFGMVNKQKKLNKANLIFTYLGIEYGIFIGLLLTIKTYLILLMPFLLAYGIAASILKMEVGVNYLTIPLMLLLWIFIMIMAKGWQRREKDHFAVLGFSEKDFTTSSYESSYGIDMLTGKITNKRKGAPLLHRIFSVKQIAMFCILAGYGFLFYDAIQGKYIFPSKDDLTQAEDLTFTVIFGLVTGLAVNVFLALTAVWSEVYDTHSMDFLVNLLFFIGVPAFFVNAVKRDEVKENIFFGCFYIGSQVFHLLIFDIMAFWIFSSRLRFLPKEWERHYNKDVTDYRSRHMEFGDYEESDNRTLDEYKEGLILHKQLEHNLKMLPPLSIIPEFYAVVTMLLTLVFFSPFYPLICLSYFPFLIVKMWLFVWKTTSCYRRPEDKPHPSIRFPGQLMILGSYVLPAYFTFILLLKTDYFKSINREPTFVKTDLSWGRVTESQFTLLAFIGVEHILLFASFILLGIVPSISNFTQNAMLTEQVNKRLHFERMNTLGKPIVDSHAASKDALLPKSVKAPKTADLASQSSPTGFLLAATYAQLSDDSESKQKMAQKLNAKVSQDNLRDLMQLQSTKRNNEDVVMTKNLRLAS